MPRSLRLRLLLSATVAVFVALAAGWLTMSYLFERHVERRVEHDLTARGRDLVAALAASPTGLTTDPAPSDPRFSRPASGLYWQVGDGTALLRSRSLWDATLPQVDFANGNGWRAGEIDGPFSQRLVVVAREVRLEAGAPALLVMLAEDHATVTAAREEFSRELGLFLLLLWAALSAAAWAQVELGLRPLEHVRAALSELRRAPTARLSQDDYPPEAAPLANAINALAEARERDLEQARRRAGDLAHALKTPLSALAAQSRRAREAGAGDAADGLDRAIEAARRAVERELARARAAAMAGEANANGRAAMEKLIQVIERTAAGERVSFVNTLSDAAYPVSEDVLMEMAGPLLENAARFARAQIRISGDGRTLVIEDDGPGLTEHEAEAALMRGRRLDESGGGHGLGLSIADDLAQATGATLALGRSDLGGLRAEIAWARA